MGMVVRDMIDLTLEEEVMDISKKMLEDGRIMTEKVVRYVGLLYKK